MWLSGGVCVISRCTHFPLQFSMLWGLTHPRTPIVAGFPLGLANEWVTRGQEKSEKLEYFFPLPGSASLLWQYLYPCKSTAPAVGPSYTFPVILGSSNMISASCPFKRRVVMAFDTTLGDLTIPCLFS